MNWLKKRIPTAVCPMCQVPFFTKTEDTEGPNYDNVDIYEHRSGLPNVESLGNNQYEVQKRHKITLVFSCRSCGYIMLFDNRIMGLT